MVSCDVESLFINIPSVKTIEILLKRVFIDSRYNFHRLYKEELRHLLSLYTQESHFQFDNKFYEQIDGVSMG